MTRLLSYVSMVVLLGVVLVSTSSAQEVDHSNKPITASGSSALLFSFGGLSTMQMGAVDLAELLYPGEGTTDARIVYAIGAKHYISDELALRALVGFGTSTSGDADKSANGKNVETLLGIGVGVEMHTRAVYAISPYVGAQVAFASAGLTNTKNTTAHTGGKSNTFATTSTETKSSASGFGVEVLAGFDWYVMQSIAIGGEYSLGFSSASASSTVAGKTTDVPSSSTIGIGAASIHLMVHF